MKKQKSAVTIKMVLQVGVTIGLATIFGFVVYLFVTKPGRVQAPVLVTGNELKNESKDAAETVLHNYLADLKTKEKAELKPYFESDEVAMAMENLSGYYDDKNIKMNSFEILKTEKIGNDKFSFLVRETQIDVKYGVAGYYENKYTLSKSNDKYLVSTIELGVYVDTSETKDWKLVENAEKGYEIKYPENFFYQEPEISVSKMAGSSSLQGCYTRKFSGFTVKKIQIGGLEYCLSESTGAAAGSTYVDSTYTNVQKDKIATLHFIIRYSNCGNFGSSESPAYKQCEVNNAKGPGTVERVVSTFKIIISK